MTIGALRLTLLLPGCFSLKDKRSRVRPILAKVREKFPVAGAEVGHLDALDASTIAFVTVSGSRQVANRTCDKIVDYVENLGLAEVADVEMDLMQW
jgi:uncharacterized protein YlxP (DUF503 family)